MRDEDSGNTATVTLVGPRRSSPDHGRALRAEAEELALVDLDDADLVPQVRNFGVAPTAQRPSSVRPVAPPLRGVPAQQPPPSRRPLPPRLVPSRPAAAPLPPPLSVQPVEEVGYEPSGVVPRADAESIIDRSWDIEMRSKRFRGPRQTSWRRGLPWIVGSALLGGLVAFVAVRASLPASAEASATDPSLGAAAPTGASPAALAATPPVAPAAASPNAAQADSPGANAGVAGSAVYSGDPQAGAAETPAAPSVASRPLPGPTAPRGQLFARAKEARDQGNAAHAKTIYRSILSADADDFDALAGMGDLAHAQGKYSDARAFYEHALAVNPSLTPAVLGLADTLWDLDDRDGARAKYRELLRRAAPSTYPARVASRAAL